MLDELASVAKRQLLLYVCLVGLHRLRADVQFIGNLARSMTRADQPINLQFPVAELRERITRGKGAVNKLLQHPLCQTFAQVNIAAQDVANCREHFLRCFLFHDVTVCTGAQGPLCISRFVMHGKNEHRQIRVLGAKHL